MNRFFKEPVQAIDLRIDRMQASAFSIESVGNPFKIKEEPMDIKPDIRERLQSRSEDRPLDCSEVQPATPAPCRREEEEDISEPELPPLIDIRNIPTLTRNFKNGQKENDPQRIRNAQMETWPQWPAKGKILNNTSPHQHAAPYPKERPQMMESHRWRPGNLMPPSWLPYPDAPILPQHMPLRVPQGFHQNVPFQPDFGNQVIPHNLPVNPFPTKNRFESSEEVASMVSELQGLQENIMDAKIKYAEKTSLLMKHLPGFLQRENVSETFNQIEETDFVQDQQNNNDFRNTQLMQNQQYGPLPTVLSKTLPNIQPNVLPQSEPILIPYSENVPNRQSNQQCAFTSNLKSTQHLSLQSKSIPHLQFSQKSTLDSVGSPNIQPKQTSDLQFSHTSNQYLRKMRNMNRNVNSNIERPSSLNIQCTETQNLQKEPNHNNQCTPATANVRPLEIINPMTESDPCQHINLDEIISQEMKEISKLDKSKTEKDSDNRIDLLESRSILAKNKLTPKLAFHHKRLKPIRPMPPMPSLVDRVLQSDIDKKIELAENTSQMKKNPLIEYPSTEPKTLLKKTHARSLEGTYPTVNQDMNSEIERRLKPAENVSDTPQIPQMPKLVSKDNIVKRIDDKIKMAENTHNLVKSPLFIPKSESETETTIKAPQHANDFYPWSILSPESKIFYKSKDHSSRKKSITKRREDENHNIRKNMPHPIICQNVFLKNNRLENEEGDLNKTEMISPLLSQHIFMENQQKLAKHKMKYILSQEGMKKETFSKAEYIKRKLQREHAKFLIKRQIDLNEKRLHEISEMSSMNPEDITSRSAGNNRGHFTDQFTNFIQKGQRKGVRGRPRKHPKKVPLPPLYVFLRNLLYNSAYNPFVVEWVDRPDGLFRVSNTTELANVWGRMKANRNEQMNYEKMSRAMRYHYGSEKTGRKGHLAMVKEKRLYYRFGELAVNWKPHEVEPILKMCETHRICQASHCLWTKE